MSGGVLIEQEADVPIFTFWNPVEAERRAFISRGTRPVTDEEQEKSKYEVGARVAAEPWRVFSFSECNNAVAVRQPQFSSFACIFRFDDQQLRVIRRSIPQMSKRSVFELLLCQIAVYCDFPRDPLFAGLSFDPVNCASISLTKEKRRVGLHIDDWDRQSIYGRDKSENRLSINVGTTDRHLMIIPVSIKAILRLLTMKIGALYKSFEDPTSLARAFMTAFPEMPVLRLTLMPGDAYVLPTELVIHDASSEGQYRPGSSLFFRGFFRMTPSRWNPGVTLWPRAMSKFA